MIATIPSASLLGVDGSEVFVEVHVSNGMPGLTIVGLPDAACREARDRVRAALLSSGQRWPMRRVTVNLAPSGLRKVGAGLDVAIAIGILVADGELTPESVEGIAFIGELGLDGSLRGVDGMVPLVDAVSVATVVVAPECAAQAALVSRHVVRSVASLAEVVAALKGESPWPDNAPYVTQQVAASDPDMADVRGQPLARWAIEIAAAGGHNLLMSGPPGSGKTMLARRLAGILPDLDNATALESTKIHSAAGVLSSVGGLIRRPPFRSPHHSASMVSLIGGGAAAMRPGEASLSHGGVLFLDEMTEFPTSVLDAFRVPLEDGFISVARAKATVCYPAKFLLIGAMNPCPCGEGLTPGACRCSEAVVARYESRISGPLRDRFDIRLTVQRPNIDQFFSSQRGEDTQTIRGRVQMARSRAVARAGVFNAHLSSAQLESVAPLSSSAKALLRSKMSSGQLTARGLFRVRRVALTLADLEQSSVVRDEHVCAALELRPGLNLPTRAAS